MEKGSSRPVDIAEQGSPRLGEKRPLREGSSSSPAKTVKFSLKLVKSAPGIPVASVFSEQPARESKSSRKKTCIRQEKITEPGIKRPVPETMGFSTPETAPQQPDISRSNPTVSTLFPAGSLIELGALSPKDDREAIKLLLNPFCQESGTAIRFSTFKDLSRFTHLVSKLLDYDDTAGMGKSFLQQAALLFEKSQKSHHTPDHLALFANSLAKLKDNDVVQNALISLSDELMERDFADCPGGRYRWGAIDISRICNALGKVMPVELVAECLEKIALEVQRRGRKHELTLKNGWEIWDFTQIVCALGKVDRMKTRDNPDEQDKKYWRVAEAMDAVAYELLGRSRNKQWPGKEKVYIRDLQMLAGGFAHIDLRAWSHVADDALLMIAKLLSELDFSAEEATTKRLCELAVSLSHCHNRVAEQQVESIASEYLKRLLLMEKQKLPQTVSVLNSLCRLTLNEKQVELASQLLEKAVLEEAQLAESSLTRDQIYWHLTILNFSRYGMHRSPVDVSKLSRKAHKTSDSDLQRGQLMQWQLNMIRRYWRDISDSVPKVETESTVKTTTSKIQREVYETLQTCLPRSCRIKLEAEIDSLPVDILLPDEKICIEVDGHQHFIFADSQASRESGQQATKPVVRAKYRFTHAMLESMGYTVFRISVDEARSVAARKKLAEKIRHRINHH